MSALLRELTESGGDIAFGDERDVELKKAKQARSAGGNDKAKPLDTGLPENFDEIVRRIYGVEIKDETRRAKDEKGSCPL